MKQSRLVIVSTCKPFVGEDAQRQRNAIVSWVEAVGPNSVLLVGNEIGVPEICAEFGLLNDAIVERVEGRLPTLSGVLNSPSLEMAEFICYVNADVLLPVNTLDVVDRVASRFSQFMIVGERWNINLKRAVTPDEIRTRSIEVSARKVGHLPGPHWIDYFIYPQGLLGDIPGMAIAGGLWDHWLVGRALKNGAAVVDATHVLTAIHQEHSRPDSKLTEDRRRYNLNMIDDPQMLATIADATHQLSLNGAILYTGMTRRTLARLLHFLKPVARITRPIRRRLGLNLDLAYRAARR